MTEIVNFALGEAEDWKDYVSPPGPQAWDQPPIKVPGIDDCAVVYTVSSEDGRDTMYIRVQDDYQGNWYYQMTLDCGTAGFCEDYGKTFGPYKSHSEAALAAYNPEAITWFIDNGVRYVPDEGLQHLLDQEARKYRQQRESLEGDEFKDLYAPGEPEYSLSQIRSAVPNFFNRSNTKFFGTRAVYKYKGNYVVLKNVRKFSNGIEYANYAIYQWKRTEDTPEGDLFHVGSANDLEDAKWMIKNQDFRPRRERMLKTLGIEETLDDFDVKDVFSPVIPKEFCDKHRLHFAFNSLDGNPIWACNCGWHQGGSLHEVERQHWYHVASRFKKTLT